MVDFALGPCPMRYAGSALSEIWQFQTDDSAHARLAKPQTHVLQGTHRRNLQVASIRPALLRTHGAIAPRAQAIAARSKITLEYPGKVGQYAANVI